MQIWGVETSKHQYISDDELLELYKSTGNNQWLGTLLERYTVILLGYCVKNLKNVELARDTVQQIQLSVLRWAGTTEIDSFRGWIIGIAKNECARHFRGQELLLRELVRTEMDLLPAEEKDMAALERAALLAHLPGALRQVVEPQRECLLLFYIHQLSYKDIADKTGYRVSEVKSHIQNGKRNLKNILKRHEQ